MLKYFVIVCTIIFTEAQHVINNTWDSKSYIFIFNFTP